MLSTLKYMRLLFCPRLTRHLPAAFAANPLRCPPVLPGPVSPGCRCADPVRIAEDFHTAVVADEH